MRAASCQLTGKVTISYSCSACKWCNGPLLLVICKKASRYILSTFFLFRTKSQVRINNTLFFVYGAPGLNLSSDTDYCDGFRGFIQTSKQTSIYYLKHRIVFYVSFLLFICTVDERKFCVQCLVLLSSSSFALTFYQFISTKFIFSSLKYCNRFLS